MQELNQDEVSKMKLKHLLSSMVLSVAAAVMPTHAAPILSDIVFVVDESGSMGNVQSNLREYWPVRFHSHWHRPGGCAIWSGGLWVWKPGAPFTDRLHGSNRVLYGGAKPGCQWGYGAGLQCGQLCPECPGRTN